MSNYHCYLCASDDGIQLDIFGVGGKAICEKIESCLSVKIEESNAISTKICHKCAFELDACNKFVAKYRQARDSKKGKSNTVKRHCSLCLEPGKIGYIFECKLGNPINDILHKVQEIFNDNNFNDKRRTLSICLDCRYNLDVLFDLKCIYQSTPDKLRRLREASLQLSELPKTKTRVVNRKTTYIPVSRLNSTEGYDTDSSSVTSIMSYKRKRGRPRKDSEPTSPSTFRTCEQCETSVENGLDMYRYHRTGMTVCKDCWLAMDPEKVTHNKRKKLGLAGGDVGTRRCAIILKDVLTNPAKYENIYKVEKDEHGNTTFIVTDDSSENEEREKTPAKRSRRNHGSVASVDLTPVKRDRPPKRTASTKSTDLDDEPPAKIRDRRKKIVDDVTSAKTKDKVKKIDVEKPPTTRSTRTRNGLAVSDTEVFESRTRRRLVGQSTDNEKNSKAASDAELTKPLAKKRSPRTRLEKSEPADSSSSETKTVATTKDRKAARNAAPVVSTTDSVERPVRRTRAQSLSSKDAATLPTSRLSKVSKSVSEAESSPTKIKRTKTKSLSPKNSASELEVENPYTCTVCLVEYRNKLIGMKHELTHAKQPEVKLQRVAIPETIVEEAPAESSLIEEPEEQSHDVSSTSENQPGDSENVETSVPVASQEEASIDVLANENKENLEESKSLPEVDETATKIDEKEEIMEDKITDNTDEKEDRIEDKASENEVDETIKKTQDKTEETEDKIEDKTEETEDKIEDKTEETEDKTEDKTEETEDKIEDNTEETEGKTEDKTEETEDKTEDKTDEIKDKTENKIDETEDKTENKTDETEDKTENKTDETEDKTENKMDDIEDKTENQNDETEDNTEDKMNETEDTIENEMNETEDTIENEKDETEDKTENKMDETEDKTENEMDETEDKTENKMDETQDKTEEKTDAPEVAKAETTVENKICDENNVENSRQDEENDISTIAESDKNNEDEETEITALIAADSKTPESTLNDEIEKEVESTELVEKFSEEVLNESEELSENLNGVNVDDEPNSEVNNANGVEKNAIAVNNDAESKTVDDSTREKSIEPDDVPSVTSTAPEMDNEVQDVVKDKISSDEEDTAKDLEEEPEAATTEDTIAPEINTTKDSEESESIVSDVLTEVFDLATAEVQKRMENEPSRDEKCTTPVSETLENISREISNSADMPSLEPLVDNQSSNIQS